MHPLIDILPRVNAALNAVAAVLLVIGYVLIRQRRIEAHQWTMVSAFGVSVLFLASYVTYHTIRQIETGAGHTKWEVPGALGWTYYGVLISHVILAAAVPFLAIASLWLGWRRRDRLHRRVSKWTWPIWMYVSITGVIVYLMLYHLHPALR
jgi:putative membrane protein